MAYSLLADRCTTEEELERLDISLGMAEDPEEAALAALRAHQEEAGMTFEDPDAPVVPFGAQDPEDPWR